MTLELENEYGAASVDTAGARVVSWVPWGGEEVLFMPPRPDGRTGEWRHGGIPVCFPWFGTNWVPVAGPGGGRNGQDARCPSVGAPLHGLLHGREWAVVGETPSTVTLEVVSDAAMKAWFAGDFRLRLDVTLGKALELRLEIENTGSEPFAYTNGFHPYFRVGDCAGAEVDGVNGCRYWYGTGFGPEPWKGPVTFGEHRDHVFWIGAHRQTLTDRLLGRCIVVESSGNRRLVVWNPGPKGCDGLSPEDWRDFVCVEPATIPASDGFTIRPGERQALEMSISVERI